MKRAVTMAAVAVSMAFAGSAAFADAPAKNWTAPAAKIYAQALSDATMKAHPDLLSVLTVILKLGRLVSARLDQSAYRNYQFFATIPSCSRSSPSSPP